MEMVYPKDLLRYLELTGFREETVLEKDRFGVESGELIVSPKVRDFPLRDKNRMPSMKKSNQLRLTFVSWEHLAKS